MWRATSITIVVLWLLLLGFHVHRGQQSVERLAAPGSVTDIEAGSDWMGVYHEGKKIGYTRNELVLETDGYAFSESSVLRMMLLDQPQLVRARVSGHADRSLALRDVEFHLQSGVGDLMVRAVVADHALRISLTTGSDTSQQVAPLPEAIYLPSLLRASLRQETLVPGRQREVLVFDPMTLRSERATITVKMQERIPGTESAEGLRVEEEFHGLRTQVWLDAQGVVMREEGPMGFAMVRESEEQALRVGWPENGALDLARKVAVPVAQAIADPRGRRSLRVRLGGISLERIPSDEEQRRDGEILAIVRAAADEKGSYTLPHAGADQAEYLRATPFMQSEHPRLRAAAAEALRGETDALKAVRLLNQWVYDHLRKVPTVSVPNALQVLEAGEGDCNEHAVLLAAMARAAGVPARMVAGVVYLDRSFLYHAWCEMWLGRWVSVDPALNQFPVDATHIKLVEGDLDAQLSLLDVIGRLQIEVLTDGPLS
jgi:hypothetical protein